MELSVHGFHRAFFQQRGWLQLDELLTLDEVQEIAKEATVGYDLWRRSPTARKIVLRRRLANLISQLIDVESLRLGYDQLLPKGAEVVFSPSIQGVAGGLLIPLESQLGSGIYLHPDHQFPALTQPHLLITYVTESAVYRHHETDPYVAQLRDLGYAFGDRLTEPRHPLLIR